MEESTVLGHSLWMRVGASFGGGGGWRAAGRGKFLEVACTISQERISELIAELLKNVETPCTRGDKSSWCL